jgi:16S rRNA (uracil1498-N3)-methyltransferase
MLSERTTALPLRKVLSGQRATKTILAIGPEGGWTDAEFAAAKASGFQEASLGRLILRTETAVVSALASLNFAFGDD